MQIAIDGPAGAGKSTVAKLVADKLGFLYVDTGAMYRALTFQVLQQGIDPKDDLAVFSILQKLDIKLLPPASKGESCRVLVNHQEVTDQIRDPSVSQNVAIVASHALVRKAMVDLQRRLAASTDVVMDGRDIGTTVLPQADVKVFLTASTEERARRRCAELVQQGYEVNLNDLAADIQKRDHLDMTREVSPLRKADDAVEIDTTHLSIDQVVDRVLELVARREKRV